MIVDSNVHAQVQSCIYIEGFDEWLFLFSCCNVSQFGVSASGIA
jgi:hypothetical protein